MHPFLFMAIHHALIVAIVSFFILFAASKAGGFVQIFGNVLGYLLLLLAVLLIVWSVAAPLLGWHGFYPHHDMMHPWNQPQQGPPPPQ
jgi:hypothetical protein